VRSGTRNRPPARSWTSKKAASRVSPRCKNTHTAALITPASVEELGLEVGQRATALIEATDVMVLVDEGWNEVDHRPSPSKKLTADC
jgi:molybdopterin-binding protein